MTLQSFVAKLPQHVHLPDDTLTLALDGYGFIRARCRELGTDAFETRVMLQRTICMLGREAAQLFYSDKVHREGAAPKVSLLGPLEVARLVDKALAQWRAVEWTGRVKLIVLADKSLSAWTTFLLQGVSSFANPTAVTTSVSPGCTSK